MTETMPEPERMLITEAREYGESFGRLLELARRELRIFDPDLVQLELNAAANVERLSRFLRSGPNARLYVVVQSDAALSRHMPRFSDLVSRFSTVVAVHKAEGEATRAQDCFVLADADHFVRRPVASQPRGTFVAHDPRDAALMRERFDQIWESSSPTAPPTTLGL